ncbi:hypothetical protein [Xanthomonas sp. 4461]|uniref:hypothetical protein n=1 Tax=Xanthomonas sp. 4461 TaxID=3035313 RepID=UPI0021687F84|nr:hypothetical protein [Xanthomonas sp. 4461]MCS3810905.1 hypothetical protein [Xanthomonas sp. 4461]
MIADDRHGIANPIARARQRCAAFVDEQLVRHAVGFIASSLLVDLVDLVDLADQDGLGWRLKRSKKPMHHNG